MENAAPLQTVSAVQSVGVAPGHAGSRAGLLPFQSSALKPPSRKHLDADAAVNKIEDAPQRDLGFDFEQTNPKQHVSGSRYDVHKAATSFADLEVFRNQMFDVARGTRVLKGLPESKGGDLCE